jgi:hypothetical protein
MDDAQLAAVNERVRRVAEEIQPLLSPHAGLARRNAHAHVWLGIKVVLGETWRQDIAPESVNAFLEWMRANPNADYQDYTGPSERLSPQEQGRLF